VKKLVLVTITTAVMLMISSAAMAQAGQTTSGTLTVQAIVNSSLTLIFNSDASGIGLSSGDGTSTATLNFGNISAFGPLGSPNITRTVVPGTSFTVSTPVDVTVSKANITSANYTLKAQLGTADATNTWAVGGTTVTGASAATITSTGAYGAKTPETIAITVPFATAGGTSVNNTISFTATTN
jgi:hypothetical protein